MSNNHVYMLIWFISEQWKQSIKYYCNFKGAYVVSTPWTIAGSLMKSKIIWEFDHEYSITILSSVTVYVKCDQICINRSKSHRIWNPFYGEHQSLTLALARNAQHMAINGQVCFRRPFAISVRPLRYTIGSLGPVNGNKDVSGTRLLPMTVSTYPMDWICFCHLLKTALLPVS